MRFVPGVPAGLINKAWCGQTLPKTLENILIPTRSIIYSNPTRTVRCHNCNSYCCSTRPVPSHNSYLRDRYHVAMIRTCNAFWAGDYYPVLHHRCDLIDPNCGVPGSLSSWDPTDWLGKRARLPQAAYFPHSRRCSFHTGAPRRSGASGYSTWLERSLRFLQRNCRGF